MNQAQAASTLGLSESQVSRLASGKRGPSPETMVRVERHFRWSVDSQIGALRDGHWWADFAARMEHVAFRGETKDA